VPGSLAAQGTIGSTRVARRAGPEAASTATPTIVAAVHPRLGSRRRAWRCAHLEWPRVVRAIAETASLAARVRSRSRRIQGDAGDDANAASAGTRPTGNERPSSLIQCEFLPSIWHGGCIPLLANFNAGLVALPSILTAAPSRKTKQCLNILFCGSFGIVRTVQRTARRGVTMAPRTSG
jgi:hypothetical protein